MKITRFDTQVVRLPADNPLSIEPSRMQMREFVTLELHTDEGLTGVGVTFCPGPLTASLGVAVNSLAALVVGHDPMSPEGITSLILMKAGNAGPGGILTLALSAIDTACWDLKGQFLGRSVCNLLGGLRDSVPAYASGALLRGVSLDMLARTAADLVARGFRQIKMQCGSEPTLTSSVERVRVVRQSVGPDIDVMCDINQLWDVTQAIEFGRRSEPCNLYWIEDPTAHDDFQGLSRISSALRTPIAGGEYPYGITPFRQLLEASSVDIVMVDLLHVGGITQWLKVAGMAEAFNLPVVSHLLPEIQLHLLAAIPNGLTLEYFPSTQALWEEVPTVTQGKMTVPQKPGLGLTFDQATIRRYQLT